MPLSSLNPASVVPIYTDYDSPWKEIIEIYFEQFIAFFFLEANSESWHT